MIHHGDLFDVLPTLDVESIDACVTDPPYGIGFMGKKWDSFAPGEAEKRIVVNHAIESTNPNLKGRTRSPASSPSAVEYDRGLAGQREFQAWTERWAREVFRVLKPGAYLLGCGAPRSFHRMTSGLEDAGFEIRDCLSWLYGSGFPKSLNLGDGRGTALKPGWEPIIIARKPFKGTVAANVEKYGTGALNIDACRLAGIPPSVPQPQINANPDGRTFGYKTGEGRNGEMSQDTLGRWPANVLLDEAAAVLLDEQSGITEEIDRVINCTASIGYGGSDVDFQTRAHGGRGGASRFYYVAKPSREERDFGCEWLSIKTGGEATDRVDGSAGVNNPRAGAGRTGGSRNFHPTVKPVELMRWLVKLVTSIGGTVLDPFLGSGTTGMACVYEQRTFVGIEREAEYVAIAERRIAAVAPLFGGVV